MEYTPSQDPVWDDLAALAFELLAKPDSRLPDRPEMDTREKAETEEGEQ